MVRMEKGDRNEIIAVVLIMFVFSILYVLNEIFSLVFVQPIFLGTVFAFLFFIFYDISFIPWYKKRKK
jgi:hypothetical protein